MDNKLPPQLTRTEIILRLVISGLLLFIALIGYITLIWTKELKSLKIIIGAILILWGIKGEKAKGFWLNKWVMRIGGISLIISGIINFLN